MGTRAEKSSRNVDMGTDSGNNINVWDTPDNMKVEELIFLATSSGLPRQVIDCLLECGYDTLARVADLVDVAEMETFLRENSFLYCQQEKRRRLYGLFENDPTKFRFLPGHRSSLKSFIDLCRNRESEKDDGGVHSNHAPVTTAVERPQTRKSARRAAAMAAAAAVAAASSATLDEPRAAKVTTSRNMHSPSVTDKFLKPAEVLEDMKRKLAKWSQTHHEESVRQLRLESEYRINIHTEVDDCDAPAASDFKSRALPLSSYGVEIVCMMCSGKVRLLARKNSFIASNATRHLFKCASGYPPKKRRRRQMDSGAGFSATADVGSQQEMKCENIELICESDCPPDGAEHNVETQNAIDGSYITAGGGDIQIEDCQQDVGQDADYVEATYNGQETQIVLNGPLYFIDESNHLQKLDS